MRRTIFGVMLFLSLSLIGCQRAKSPEPLPRTTTPATETEPPPPSRLEPGQSVVAVPMPGEHKTYDEILTHDAQGEWKPMDSIPLGTQLSVMRDDYPAPAPPRHRQTLVAGWKGKAWLVDRRNLAPVK